MYFYSVFLFCNLKTFSISYRFDKIIQKKLTKFYQMDILSPKNAYEQ